MSDIPHPPSEATSAHATVEQEDGQWVVILTVIFDDGVVRRRIQRYRTARHAEIAAIWVERSANRDLKAKPL